jgi:hypothetical protein
MDFYIMAIFLQLPNTSDVGVEVRNDKDVGEHPLFTGLALV